MRGPTLLAAFSAFATLAATVTFTLVGCGLESITQGGGGGTSSTGDGGADAAAEAGITGAGCGVEPTSGANLCRATSQCPSVVVDSQEHPHCGFRIKGSASELVCGCGDSVCSMGAFTTCAQAAQLLAAQSEAQVCTQIAEGRCTAASPGASSSSSGGSSGSTCDKTCLAECGGGAACASVCGC